MLDSPAPPIAAEVARLRSELGAGDEASRAVLLNLEEEDRLPQAAVEAFQREAVASAEPAAVRVARGCGAAKWELPVSGGAPPAAARTWHTHHSVDKLTRLGFVAPATLRPRHAPPALPLARRLGERPDGTREDPVWASDYRAGDADEVRNRLGLDRVGAGEALYRVDLPLPGGRPAWVPAAPDAEAAGPWRRPPAGAAEPWGLTRDLRTDAPAERELLFRAVDADPTRAELVGTTHTPAPSGWLGRRLR